MKVFAQAARFDREKDAIAWALGIAAWEIRTLRQRRQRRREEGLEDSILAVVAIYLDIPPFGSNVDGADKVPKVTGGVGIPCRSHAVQSPRPSAYMGTPIPR